jgi:hypothetical protein
MGGSAPSVDTSFLGAQPRQGQPLNFNRILGQAQKAGDALWQQQQGYIGGIENQLRNSSAMQAGFGALNDARAAGFGMQNAETGMMNLGGQYGALATRAINEADPTSIERELYRQGEADLALGRSLSPEQQRQAEQSARAAMQARGLATSNAGVAAELLNRDAYGQQREDARRNFAASANNMMSDNVIKRRTAATQYGAQAGNLMQGAGSLAGQRFGLLNQAAGQYAAMDPTAMSYQLGGQLAQNTAMGGLDFAGNLASFNTNRQDSLYNSWMNNTASLNAANMQASAAGSAGNSALLGAGIGALGTIGGTALGGPLGGMLGGSLASTASSAALPSTRSMWGM